MRSKSSPNLESKQHRKENSPSLSRLLQFGCNALFIENDLLCDGVPSNKGQGLFDLSCFTVFVLFLGVFMILKMLRVSRDLSRASAVTKGITQYVCFFLFNSGNLFFINHNLNITKRAES